MAALLHDGDRLVEVVVLHRTCGVNRCNRGRRVEHELVAFASVIQVVAQRADEECQALETKKVSSSINRVKESNYLVGTK